MWHNRPLNPPVCLKPSITTLLAETHKQVTHSNCVITVKFRGTVEESNGSLSPLTVIVFHKKVTVTALLNMYILVQLLARKKKLY